MSNKPTIFLCDDDAGILSVTQIILNRLGYHVNTHNSGIDFLQKIGIVQPDLILMDIVLGGVPGDLLATQIKTNQATRHIPVILFSTLNNLEKIALELKVDGFIKKPFEIDEMKRIINKHLQ